MNPTVPEVCDGIDNDCNDIIDTDAGEVPVWYVDADGDGFGVGEPMEACTQPEGYVAVAGDCNDEDDVVYPGAEELCDGLDNDCDELVDEDGRADWYADVDNDGFGDPAAVVSACAQPTGYVSNPLDCDDVDDAVNPAAIEVCNGIDDNCRDGIDETSAADAPTWYRDADGDTWGRAAETTRACAQPAGFVGRAGDCNDDNGAVSPGAAEVSNGIDDNCAGGIDEGVLIAFYRDADGDGWGNTADVVLACANPGGRVTSAGDCDDANFRRNPGLTERCDGIDNNCDGTFTSIERRGRTVEYDASCQNFGGGNANDLCFGEAWNGQGYMHCHYHQSWDQARSVCQARGMDLTEMNSAEENAAVIGAFNGQDGESWDDLWIGGRETATTRQFTWARTGTMFWNNGSVGLYTNWRSGEPSNDVGGGNNDCTSVYQSDFRWNDRSCGGSIEFICEW